jgi:hypothetical protein
MSYTSIGTVWVASFFGEIVIHDLYTDISHHLFGPGLMRVGDHDPFQVGELLIIVLVGREVPRRGRAYGASARHCQQHGCLLLVTDVVDSLRQRLVFIVVQSW